MTDTVVITTVLVFMILIIIYHQNFILKIITEKKTCESTIWDNSKWTSQYVVVSQLSHWNLEWKHFVVL